MIKVALKNSKSGKDLLSQDNGEGPVLITSTYGAANGHFKAETLTAAGSVTVVAPLTGDGVVLTDLIMTTDKTNGATATVIITDGTNSITLVSGDMTNAPVNIAIPFGGLWQGWRSAAVQLDMVGANGTATLAIGYYHTQQKDTLTFSEWDALRL